MSRGRLNLRVRLYSRATAADRLLLMAVDQQTTRLLDCFFCDLSMKGNERMAFRGP